MVYWHIKTKNREKAMPKLCWSALSLFIVFAAMMIETSFCIYPSSNPIQRNCVMSNFSAQAKVPNGGVYSVPDYLDDATTTTRRRRKGRSVTEPGNTVTTTTDEAKAGDKPVSRNIISGLPANPKEFPFLVAILRKGDTLKYDGEYWDLVCGGTLIHKRFVLTAAHCFISEGIFSWTFTKATQFAVRIGDYSLLARNISTAVTARVIRYAPHPSFTFDDVRQGNDVAVVQLDRDISFNDYAKPACLPGQDYPIPPANQPCKAVGRGSIDHDGDVISSYPRQTTIWTSSNDICYAALRVPQGAQDSRLFCAGDPTGEADTCQGDSGGPLVCLSPKHNVWIFAGIVSFGIEGCGVHPSPGAYTAVSHYTRWINSTMARLMAMGETMPSTTPSPRGQRSGTNSQDDGEQGGNGGVNVPSGFSSTLRRLLAALLGPNSATDGNGHVVVVVHGNRTNNRGGSNNNNNNNRGRSDPSVVNSDDAGSGDLP